jgi:multiple sugar transport system substrate-binding protein
MAYGYTLLAPYFELDEIAGHGRPVILPHPAGPEATRSRPWAGT